MECEQTMSDYAHIVREALRTAAMIEETYRDALAALDRILAERDELLRLWHCTPEDKAGMDANLLRVEAERDTANADWHRMRDLHADALTEVERLKEAMDLAMHDHGNAYEILGDALANEDA